MLVQGLCMRALAREPGDDGGLPVAEDPLSGRRVQPKGSRSQHHCDLVRGGFQTIQGGMAPSTERSAAGLAAKRLDLFSVTMGAIPNQGMNLSVCDPEVRALLVGTGEALSVYAFRGPTPAFHLVPGAHRERRWPHNR